MVKIFIDLNRNILKNVRNMHLIGADDRYSTAWMGNFCGFFWRKSDKIPNEI